ncbi:MAG TPA: ATP-binding protein [Solirubrobacteraceae bacterium]|jgi:anti-sigma regulatory factor (Ser/Thr protein kinase)|nr:ATP-binding protein [Solirubrobacteraceae bacterium]
MAESPNVCLTLSNQPDNVVLVREALSGIADTVGVDELDLNDIRTAVTEACNNVVLHAYEGDEGPLQVEVFVSPLAVEVVVRDHGTGIKPHIRSEQEAALGIGLSIIQALAPRVEFRDVPGGGTEVRMEFAAASAGALESPLHEGYQPPDVARGELATTSALAVAPSALARKVLPRVMCVLAARAHFTTDRISDTELVADALVATAAAESANAHLSMSISVEPRNLELRIGPLQDGHAERLVASTSLGGVGSAVERLISDHSVASGEGGEVLALQLRDER